MLPGLWRNVALFNPVVYLVSGFRWSFYEVADISVAISLGMTLVFFAVCVAHPGYSTPAIDCATDFSTTFFRSATVWL